MVEYVDIFSGLVKAELIFNVNLNKILVFRIVLRYFMYFGLLKVFKQSNYCKYRSFIVVYFKINDMITTTKSGFPYIISLSRGIIMPSKYISTTLNDLQLLL